MGVHFRVRRMSNGAWELVDTFGVVRGYSKSEEFADEVCKAIDFYRQLSGVVDVLGPLKKKKEAKRRMKKR